MWNSQWWTRSQMILPPGPVHLGGDHTPWLLHPTPRLHHPLVSWSQLRNSPRPVSTPETSAGAAVESCVNFIVVAVDNIVPHRNIGLGDTCTTCTQWKLIIKEICISNRNWLGVEPCISVLLILCKVDGYMASNSAGKGWKEAQNTK